MSEHDIQEITADIRSYKERLIRIPASSKEGLKRQISYLEYRIPILQSFRETWLIKVYIEGFLLICSLLYYYYLKYDSKDRAK